MNMAKTRTLRLSAGVALLALAACETTDAPGAADPRLETRAQDIRNGTREPEAVALTPGQVLALGWLFQAGDPSANFCTATLIGPTTIITASHCTQGSRPQDMGFGVGLMPSDPDATFRVAAIYDHPQLDMSVIALSENALDRLPQLEPIPVNTADPSSLEGTEVQVGGYGETYDRTRSGRYFATVLLSQVRGDEIVVDGQGRQGLCFGDSGGPVIGVLGPGPVVMGVESWGDQSCVDVDHLTRTDVDPDFIRSILDGGAPPDACNGLDYLGHCVGQVAEWCEGGALQSVDCIAEGGHCDYVDDQTGWYCVEGPPPAGGADQGVNPGPLPDAGPTPPEADAGAGGASGGNGGESGQGGDPAANGGENGGGTIGPVGPGAGGAGVDGADAALDDADAGAKGSGAESSGGSTGCSAAPARAHTPGSLAFLGLPLVAALRRLRRRTPRTTA
jgi:hypothetical protein